MIAPPDESVQVIAPVVVTYVPVPGAQDGVAAVGVTPVPERADVCGLAPSPPLYETLRVVDRAPLADGVNVAVNVQEPLDANDPPAALHDPAPELVMVKSPEFPPVVLGVIDVAVAPLPFVTVNVTGELEEPMLTDPKFWLDGESVTFPGLE